jgi:hypothetical protein
MLPRRLAAFALPALVAIQTGATNPSSPYLSHNYCGAVRKRDLVRRQQFAATA